MNVSPIAHRNQHNHGFLLHRATGEMNHDHGEMRIPARLKIDSHGHIWLGIFQLHQVSCASRVLANGLPQQPIFSCAGFFPCYGWSIQDDDARRMKLFKNSTVTLSLAALSCLFVSCANPIGSLVQDTIRAPFVALGATTSAVATVPYAVSSTSQSLNNTYNQLGTNAQNTLSPSVTKANNTAATWTN